MSNRRLQTLCPAFGASVVHVGLRLGVAGWQDAEALALAEELKAVFEGAGFKTRKLAQYVPPRNLPSGVAVFSSHQLDAVLSEAIAQIFAELGQERIQWLEDDPVPAANPAEPQPELKIIVSHR